MADRRNYRASSELEYSGDGITKAYFQDYPCLGLCIAML